MPDARTVTVTTTLDADADTVWRALRSPQTFVHVAGAMLRYPAAERLDRPFTEGDQIVGWTLLGGIVPFSRHHLRIAAIDDAARQLLSDEHGGVVRTWRHMITVTPASADRSDYVDTIEIDAGVLTPVVVGFARVFYRYRQRRWRRLARLLADAEAMRAQSN
jgi:hypothetical protein